MELLHLLSSSFLLCFWATSPILPAVSLFSLYCFFESALRWPRTLTPSNKKTDYQLLCPRKLPSIYMSSPQLLLFTFYILGPFFQDTHNDLEPAPRGLILLLLHSLWTLLLFLHVSTGLVTFLKIVSLMIAWNCIGSAVGKWSKISSPYMLRKSSVCVFPTDARAEIKFARPLTWSYHFSLFQGDIFNYRVMNCTGWYISATLTDHLLSYSGAHVNATCCCISILLLVGWKMNARTDVFRHVVISPSIHSPASWSSL